MYKLLHEVMWSLIICIKSPGTVVTPECLLHSRCAYSCDTADPSPCTSSAALEQCVQMDNATSCGGCA
jgi:hypothetical protein